MPLQELCLTNIINNFDRYYMLFYASEDAKIERLFEFLQRKYSFKIASRLYAKEELSEKYIDLLVNKHLKVIDTVWFKNCSWKTICSKFAEIGSKLVKIQFHDVFIEECPSGTPWQDIICHLPNLEVLCFQDDCHDKILESIAKYCSNIIEIDLRSSCVTDDGIKTLCLKEDGKVSCSKLKRLFVGSTNVGDDGVEDLLKNLPSLEFIDYFDLPMLLYKLHKDNLSALDKVEPYKLTNLDLLNYALVPFSGDLIKICLSLCPNLKVLSSQLCDEDHIELFSHLSHLEKLHIENSSDSFIDINNLLKSIGGQVTSLTLQRYIVSVSVLAKHCTHLKQLYLNTNIFIVDEDDDSKLLFPCLDSCTFEVYPTNDSKTDKAVKLLLSSSPNLESIGLKSFSVLSQEIKTQILKCCENCSIKSINLSNSVVEMPFLRDIIMNCLSLKSLILEGCDLEDEHEQELYSLAEGRPNHPSIFLNEELSISDFDDFLNDYYDFEDELEDDDFYDDFYVNHYDYEEEDVDDDYGYYFEL